MGGGSSPPQPQYDPMTLMKADVQGTVASNIMNNPNVYSPFGSSTYKYQTRADNGKRAYTRIRIGNNPVTGKPQWMKVPKFEQTITLSDAEQAKYDLQNKLQMRLGEAAYNQIGQIEDLLGTPFDPDNLGPAPIYDRAKYEEALYSRLRPEIEKDRQARDAHLASSGIGLGTDAYEESQRLGENAVTDARIQAVLKGGEYADQEFGQMSMARERALQEALMKREIPLREIQALLGNVELNTPQFSPWRGQSLPNFSDIAFRDYENQLKVYQMEQQQKQAAMSGAFGLGQSVIGGLFGLSDRRLKTDIVQIGKDERGFAIYSFRYIGDPAYARTIGVMAQEVAPILPEAVITLPSGFMAVNYGAL